MNDELMILLDKLEGHNDKMPMYDEELHRNQQLDADRLELKWKHEQELASFDRYFQNEILELTQKLQKERMKIIQRHFSEMNKLQCTLIATSFGGSTQ
jgi:NTP pyrophosphatase (non-canonical NTP hydrolase)